MSALPSWASIRQQVLDDARLGTGYAHLESDEVPRWIEDANDHDVVGTLSEALSNSKEKRRDTLNSLLTLLCEHGDEIAQRKAVDLLDLLRAVMTDHCIRQAQAMVDREFP